MDCLVNIIMVLVLNDHMKIMKSAFCLIVIMKIIIFLNFQTLRRWWYDIWSDFQRYNFTMQCLSQIYLSYLWVCDILHLWTNMKRRVLVGSLVWPEEIQLGRTPSHLLNLQIFVQSQSHLLSLKNTQVSNVLMETIASFEGIMYKGARVATTMRLLPDRLIFGLSENCLKLVDPEEMHHNVKSSCWR